MKKLTINNIIWTILLIIIGFEIYGYISDYFKLQDYKYGNGCIREARVATN